MGPFQKLAIGIDCEGVVHSMNDTYMICTSGMGLIWAMLVYNGTEL